MRFVLTLALALGVSSVTLAHDPPEVIQFVSTKPDDVLLTTNRGLVFGNLMTRQWSLLCNSAVGTKGTSTAEPYRLAVLPSGRMVVATANGLSFSDDRGCSFTDHADFASLTTRGLVQDPTNAQHLYVLAEGQKQNGIRFSEDGGESWTPVFAGAEDEYMMSLLLASGEPPRLYASIWQLGPNVDAHFVLRSSDRGATWERTPIELTETELDVTLLAVNPTDPDELLARASGSDPAAGERLLHSRDGGRTFSSSITINALKSATFSPDGKTAYAAGVDGLFRATAPDRVFTRAEKPARISAVRSTESELLVAGYYEGLELQREGTLIDGVGRAMPGSEVFEPWMAFREVQSQISCPASSTANSKCATLWADWKVEHPPLGDAGTPTSEPDAGAPSDDPTGQMARDGGPRDAGTRDAAMPREDDVPEESEPVAAKSSDGCSVARPGARGVGLAGWLLLGSALLLAASRRRPAR